MMPNLPQRQESEKTLYLMPSATLIEFIVY
jgi:hypothetical protein